MAVSVGVIYDKVVENSQDINKLHGIIQNSSTGELIISNDEYLALINDIFGGDV